MTNVDNRVQLQDCEDAGEVSADATAVPAIASSDAGAVIQGTNSVAFQVDDAQEVLLFDGDSSGSAFNVDMSDMTVYINIKHNICEAFANLGAQIALGDTAAAGDIIGYNVAGNDVAGFPYLFRYTGYKLDVSVIVATPGTDDVDFYTYSGTESTLDHTAILQVGYGSFSVEKAISTGKNAWCDGIYYIANSVSSTTGYALSITGGTVGTPETTADVAADDVAAGGVMVNNPKGSEYGFFAPTEWGDSGSSDSYYTGTDEQWYLIGDNAGGHEIAATHFPFRVVGNGTSTNSFVLLRVTIVGTGVRAQFDLSNADMDFTQMTSCAMTDIGAITCPGQDADKFLNAHVFGNCDVITMNAMNMTGVTVNGSTDADGAVLLNTSGDSNNASNVIFNSDGTGHAFEISVAGTYDLDNWVYNDYGADTTTDAACYISANVAVTLNIQNNGDTPTVRDSGTAPTINNAVSVTVDGVAEGTSCKVIANESLGTITKEDVIFELLADSTGTAQIVDFNYEGAFGAGIDVKIRARNQGLANAAIADDNGSFVDETSIANNATVDDMNLLPATPVVNQDRYILGHSEQFTQLKVKVSTAGTGGFTITWQYWNGAWVNLAGVTDGTSSFSTLGTGIVSFTLPGDWATSTINSQGPFYYVRAAYTAGAVTITPLGRSATLDVTRYLPIPPTGELVRTITTDGLTATLSQAVDSIASFQ